MFYEAIIILHKELLELKSLGKRLISLLVFLTPSIFLAFGQGEGSLFPLNISIYLVLFLTTILTSGYLISDTILSEKRSKMLDVLLVSSISKTAIVIGKVILSCIVSSISIFLSILIIKTALIVSFNLLIIVPLLLTSYFSACCTMCLSMILSDEKLVLNPT